LLIFICSLFPYQHPSIFIIHPARLRTIPAANPSIMNITCEQLLGQISQIEQAIHQGICDKNIKAVMKEKKVGLVSGYVI
jgi:hypothetical protein